MFSYYQTNNPRYIYFIGIKLMKSLQQTEGYSPVFVSQQPSNALNMRLIKPSVLTSDKEKEDQFHSIQRQQRYIQQFQYEQLKRQRSIMEKKINTIQHPQISLCRSRAEVVQNKIRSLMSKNSHSTLPPISNISRILNDPNYRLPKRQHIQTEQDAFQKRSLTLNDKSINSSIQPINKNLHQSIIHSFVEKRRKKLSYNPQRINQEQSDQMRQICSQLHNFKKNSNVSRIQNPIRSKRISLRSLLKSNKSQKTHKNNYNQQFDWSALRTQFTEQLISLTKIYTIHRNQQPQVSNQSKIPKIPQKENVKQFLKRYQPKSEEISIKAIMKSHFCAVQYDTNQLYIGEMIGKKKSGMGISITQNSCFEGIWKNNEIIKGVEINTQGVFKGSYLNNLRQGRGEFSWHTGQTYVGQWKKGLKHGAGLWINTRGDTYNGEWKNGKIQGIGIFVIKCPSNSKKDLQYKGSFLNFKKHGFGRENFQNGDYFQGVYREDMPNGQGAYRWKNGSTYQGQFFEGKCDGLGVLKTPFNLVYKGQFIEDRPQGECQILLQNGDIYYGMVKNGRKNGKGTLKLKSSKQVLNGYWKDDYFVNKQEQIQE